MLGRPLDLEHQSADGSNHNFPQPVPSIYPSVIKITKFKKLLYLEIAVHITTIIIRESALNIKTIPIKNPTLLHC
jgi:hypothetical protein